MILALSYTQLFNIIHLCCYIIALVPSIFTAMSIDYPKFFKVKSNKMYYLIAFAIGGALTFLLGEFIFQIITMFID